MSWFPFRLAGTNQPSESLYRCGIVIVVEEQTQINIMRFSVTALALLAADCNRGEEGSHLAAYALDIGL